MFMAKGLGYRVWALGPRFWGPGCGGLAPGSLEGSVAKGNLQRFRVMDQAFSNPLSTCNLKPALNFRK